MRDTLLAAIAVVALAGAASARPISNGGFETGDFTDWTQFGNTGFTGVDDGSFFVVQSGTYSAFFGPVGSTGGIAQSAGLGATDVVTVSFDLYNYGDTPNSIAVKIGGNTLLSMKDAGAFGYTTYTFTGVVAVGGDVLSFTTRHDPSYWLLDNVSVTVSGTTIPLPSAAGLGFAGLADLGLRRRR